MSDLKLLIKQRGTLKGRLTWLSNFVNNLPKDSKELTNELKLEAEMRLSKSVSWLDNFNEIQDEIDEHIEDTDEQFKERESFESAFYKTMSLLRSILNSRGGEGHQLHTFNDTCKDTSHSKASAHLPKIQLNKFNGNLSNWLEFRDTYISLIHNNSELNTIDKFHYLRSSVEGAPLVMVKSVKFCQDNYNTAWEILCNRFNDKKRLISSHVKSLFNVFSVQKESAYNLRKLIDYVTEHVRSLTTLGEPVDKWDTILVHLVSTKLDANTSFEWEKQTNNCPHDKITFEYFLEFLRCQANLLETCEQNKGHKYHNYNKQEKVHTLTTTANNKKQIKLKRCLVCNSNDHVIYYCDTFLSLSPEERVNKVKSLNLCLNCLRTGHKLSNCQLSSCRNCGQNHNSLLCQRAKNCGTEPELEQTTLSCAALSAQGLLSTARVRVRDERGMKHYARVILDSGSSTNFITERLCKKLNLKTENINATINSLNKNISVSKQCCKLQLTSIYSNYQFNITCIIISNIINPWPQYYINKNNIKIPKEIKLADKQYYKTSEIDILLGNGIFWQLMEPKQLKLNNSSIILQNSKLGWILGGSVANSNYVQCNVSDLQSINNQLAKFWELDNISSIKYSHLSLEEAECENNFIKNTKRLADGRFSVTIPLKLSTDLLGDSYKVAKSRFISLENKLNTNHALKQQYIQFIQEYIQLGHMRLSPNSNKNETTYYAPHHCVMQANSITTKLRVVFDCSARSSSGYSFNDLQMIGPTIQDDLFSILLRFRQHNIVLTADIQKMYRQIEVNEIQRPFQRILWRELPNQTLQSYELNTVTYGTASAPFLAIRCLIQLGHECTDPIIKNIIFKDFYVDDLITGTNTIHDAIYIYTNLTKQLKSGCFPLHKWRSNNIDMMKILNNESTNLTKNNDLCQNKLLKTLGLNWDQSSDHICYDINFTHKGVVSKRNILKTISKLFDPLGLVLPFTLQAKIMLQKLWLNKLSWDDEVPFDIKESWLHFVNNLTKINNIRIPRHVICKQFINIELHIFTDASECAYGSCAYIRSINQDNQIFVELLCAKNKVSPLKPLTIPRLELCGALIGTRLCEKIKNSLRINFDNIFFWTDSTIVLGWLNMEPNKLQTFVRNRIAEIQSTTNNSIWQHVPTNDNPADYLTRGLKCDQVNNWHWWNGPQFLKESESCWPKFINVNQKLPDMKSNVTCMISGDVTELFPFYKFSNFNRLQRTMAYMLRFIHNIKNKNKRNSGILSIHELHTAVNRLASLSQQESYPIEYKYLKSNMVLSKGSKLNQLNPFYDTINELIRIGGRLSNSNLNYNKKYPIVIHKNHLFTQLYFKYLHKILMHTGPQHLLFETREKYWTIGGRDLARNIVRNCVICQRFNAKPVPPLMGNLPKHRMEPSFCFESTSIDYAGPIMMSNKKGRGSRLTKCYICIFVCCTTRAIHIELVTDMSTANFILSLKRFISRRGKPSNIYSDNGTNFVGANNEIRQLFRDHKGQIIDSMSNENITFHFCPPYSPHFGGLHEAGIKSIKHHLKRVLGNARLTYEELYTTLTQIEAILNSRPISPLSSDPNDLLPLTPSHFLIGKKITSIPEPMYINVPTHRLTRFQRVEQMRQHFWARWHKEYLSQIQIRSKWRTPSENLKEGDLVLIRGDQLPPMKWSLGRITSVHPGRDGIVRVADIRTSVGTVRRSFTKICPLRSLDDFEA